MLCLVLFLSLGEQFCVLTANSESGVEREEEGNEALERRVALERFEDVECGKIITFGFCGGTLGSNPVSVHESTAGLVAVVFDVPLPGKSALSDDSTI